MSISTVIHKLRKLITLKFRNSRSSKPKDHSVFLLKEMNFNLIMTNNINRDILIQMLINDLGNKYPELMNLNGYSVYSQNEEDGIISNIFEKIGLSAVKFFEFGVHPTENNTLNLLLKNGTGVWFDKGLTKFKSIINEKKSLLILDEFISINNINLLCKKGLDFLKIEKNELDFLSMDLDGNDYYFTKQIVSLGVRPKVFCLEYNAKFRLPLDIKINYSENHSWAVDDYLGCSLQAYINLLNKEYTLLVCNLTGSNCFFIRNDFIHKFKIYESSLIYMPPRYYLSPFNKGHKPSFKFLNLID
jgi:hypothetical protein